MSHLEVADRKLSTGSGRAEVETGSGDRKLPRCLDQLRNDRGYGFQTGCQKLELE